jgi:hypothetical protein
MNILASKLTMPEKNMLFLFTLQVPYKSAYKINFIKIYILHQEFEYIIYKLF